MVINIIYIDYKNNTKISSLSCLLEIIKFASKFLIDKNKILNKRPENISQLTQTYILQGKSAWIDDYPINFYSRNRTINENSVLLHRRYHGVVETGTNLEVKSLEILNELINWKNIDKISSLISKDTSLINILTCRGNMGAIITNGTAILGFGDIGAVAGLPVMEGKCVLFKLFGGTNVMPLCIQEKNTEIFNSIVQKISKSFCAINLEDIKAPECFEIESKLIETIPYPVFHDDQHGTAIVVLAGIINALRLAEKKIEDVKIVMNGAGAAGLSVTELLVTHGARNIIICDTVGAIYTGRPKNMNTYKEKLAKLTNPYKLAGNLTEVLKNSDIFIGVSAPKTLTHEMIKSMNKNPIIFALANPEPEIYPNQAKEAGAFIVATGRSDFDNQVNNSLAFPAIFRAAIDVRARKISIQMKIAASIAIANLIPSERLNPNYIIPDSLDTKVPVAVAYAVAKEALDSGLAENKETKAEEVEHNLLGWMLEEKMRNWEYIKQRNFEFIEDDLKPKSKF
jgi:malate dehydrogenase (oxaloacetate-decarboxylating)